MAKKRKTEFGGLEEVDKSLYNAFCTAANSVSQLYTQAQNQQRISFQAGERYALEKMMQWMERDCGSSMYVSRDLISNYIQNEMNHIPDSPSVNLHQQSAIALLPQQLFQNQGGDNRQHHMQGGRNGSLYSSQPGANINPMATQTQPPSLNQNMNHHPQSNDDFSLQYESQMQNPNPLRATYAPASMTGSARLNSSQADMNAMDS